MARVVRVGVYDIDEFDDVIAREGKTLKNITIEQLDGLSTGYLIKDLTFEDCSFESIDFDGTLFKNVSFKDCEFRWDEFNEVDFRKTQFLNCEFEEVTFNEVRLNMPAFLENDLERILFRNMRFAYEIESTLAIKKIALDLQGVYRTDPCTYCQRKAVKEDLCVNCWKFQRSRHQNLAEHKKAYRETKGAFYENYYPSGMSYP